MARITFFGEQFVTGENEFALLEWADAAENVEAATTAGLAATFRLLRETIVADPDVEGSTDDSEWQRFRAVARRNRATSDDLMPIVFGVVEDAADRPTEPPADSTAGREITPLRSVSSPADSALTEALERTAGRPDMQAAILKARNGLTAVAG